MDTGVGEYSGLCVWLTVCAVRPLRVIRVLCDWNVACVQTRGQRGLSRMEGWLNGKDLAISDNLRPQSALVDEKKKKNTFHVHRPIELGQIPKSWKSTACRISGSSLRRIVMNGSDRRIAVERCLSRD